MRAGETLGDRYVLERVLGQGGMGVVWAARDRTNGSRVALKMLLDDGLTENNAAQEAFRKELRQRLRREAEACMKLAFHPNVVRVSDFSTKDTDQHGPYIVMELLEGESLQQHLKRKVSLDSKVAARIAADVASCLTAAHAAKLVHRDLKPANIYLHREPGMEEDEFVTKVLDFGVCKDGDSVEKGSDRTKTGMVLGSIAYMSPQQAMGSKNVDFRTDIWSVGVVLYEMLTGLRAFSGGVDDIIAMFGPILVGKSTMPVPAPSSRTRKIPPELDAVVERCTKAKPVDRYASAEDLARDLYSIAGLPMPVIPTAKASSSGKSPIGARELIDVYESAIIGSNAVPGPNDERRFNEYARTIPLKRAVEETVAAPPPIVEERVVINLPPPAAADVLMFAGQTNVTDTSDVDVTLRMPPKGARAPMPRPPAMNEPPADAGVRTQYLHPDAPIGSPLPDLKEMQQALEEHRKSSISIAIPDLPDLDAAGGTQMLMKAVDVSPPKRSEPGVTTTGLMSQTMPEVRRESVSFDAAGTTSRRRRKNRVFFMMIGAAVTIVLGLLVVVAVMRPAPPPQEPAIPPQPTTLPLAPVSSDAETEKPAPPTPSAMGPDNPGTAKPTETVTEPAKGVPTGTTSIAPPRATTTKQASPQSTKSGPKQQNCTGVDGPFKRCGGKPVTKSKLNPTPPF